MPSQEINELKELFVKNLSPESIFLFGSFAKGCENEDSDFDFYIVMSDETEDIAGTAAKAYKSIRHVKKRPVDILVGTKQAFESRKMIPSVEKEVFSTGVMIYERRS